MYLRTYHVISLANQLSDYNATSSRSFDNLNEAEIEAKWWLKLYPNRPFYIVEVIATVENVPTYAPMISYKYQY